VAKKNNCSKLRNTPAHSAAMHRFYLIFLQLIKFLVLLLLLSRWPRQTDIERKSNNHLTTMEFVVLATALKTQCYVGYPGTHVTKHQTSTQSADCMHTGRKSWHYLNIVIIHKYIFFKLINKHKCPGEVGVQTVMLVKGKTAVGHILWTDHV